MQILIDENKYYTGSYCKVGKIKDGIEVGNITLPTDTDPLKVKSYKLNEEVKKTIARTPVIERYTFVSYQKTNNNGELLYIDEEGNETTEVTDMPYTVTEEKIFSEGEDTAGYIIYERHKVDENGEYVYEDKLVDYIEYSLIYDEEHYNELVALEKENHEPTEAEQIEELQMRCEELEFVYYDLLKEMA